jgi:signal transduction histidine kinase
VNELRAVSGVSAPLVPGPSLAGRAPHRESPGVSAVAQMAGVALLLGALQLVLLLSGAHQSFPPGIATLVPLLGWAYLTSGVMGWIPRPSSGSRALIVIAALVWMAAGLVQPTPPGLIAAGLFLATVPFALRRPTGERPSADLQASAHDLRASRARVMEAADAERRRIARDLHDGLQARLVLLAMTAHTVGAEATRPATVVAKATELCSGLHTAITELRELVQGVVPATLTEHGLFAAAAELAGNLPVPVELDLDDDAHRLPRAVETAGYYVVAEALTNAVKHSRARALAVRLKRLDGVLRIEVADDGVGVAGPASGSGIRGMADRVDVLGGRLVVHSPEGGGTSIIAEVPCGS